MSQTLTTLTAGVLISEGNVLSLFPSSAFASLQHIVQVFPETGLIGDVLAALLSVAPQAFLKLLYSNYAKSPLVQVPVHKMTRRVSCVVHKANHSFSSSLKNLVALLIKTWLLGMC